MLGAGRLCEAEVAARSQAGRVARGLPPTAVNLQGVWIERAGYVPRRGRLQMLRCRSGHVRERPVKPLSWTKPAVVSLRPRSALWTVAGQLADECRASPDGGQPGVQPGVCNGDALLSMLRASRISPPMAARLLGEQVSAFWARRIGSRHGLKGRDLRG
jgi:hypothetical protein